MKLTTRGKFAVTALLDMAIYGKEMPVNLFSISERQGISLSYLEQLFVKLRRSGIVRSAKGPGGGYSFIHQLEQVKLSEIVRAVDEDFDARGCRGLKNCTNDRKCLTHDLWDDLTKHVYSYLDTVTLKDLHDKSINESSQNIVFTKNIINKVGAKI